MKIQEILKEVNLINVNGSMDIEISSLSYDSRKVDEGSLFVAIKGLKSDGHNFLNDAVESGARAVVVENGLWGGDFESEIRRPIHWMGTPKSEVTYITVLDSRKALAVISTEFYGHPSREISIIGVTGTNGKTTTSYLINSILRANNFKSGLIGTIDYRFDREIIPSLHTTPESLDLQRFFKKVVDGSGKYCVMEVSSHSLELDRVYGTRFEMGVFTNLTQDHLDFHGNLEKYFSAKARLFKEYGLKKAVINIDDPYGKRLIKDSRIDKILTYGITEGADVKADDIDMSVKGLKFVATTPIGKLNIESKLLGMHNIYNILASVSTAILEGFSKESIIKGILLLDTVPGRLEGINEGQDFTVLVDYAHTDDALKNVLNAAKELPHKRLIVVFGCGGDRDRGKRPLMGKAAVEYSDFAIITSDNPRSEDPLKIIEEIEAGVSSQESIVRSQRHIKIPDRGEAIEFAINNASKGDIVIIAGKGHEDYQIFRDKKIHFDDREVAREAIKKIQSTKSEIRNKFKNQMT
ncbi:MAG TPA: UDP-N-acetylmuramoyl-L-alanyl-D-glutamate--2,6-diaminopimelate ligase [Nitrospinae bacterium]|nr:UDP-N-acetylmuramoyl-L-alanyl-D-glutamate--2,6-diaminopimelate ligase [Nitrospinota bacterium]HBA26163.1 UDP-N-acetylmuramoyl-L-alanyl-D-glutamate--2,6-diaminopimelate ligase [Nitrospinota bacterium]